MLSKKIALLTPLVDGKSAITPRWESVSSQNGLGIVRVYSTDSLDQIRQKLNSVSGLLMPGGDSNVHPKNYDQKPSYTQLFNESRDEMAFNAFPEARKRKMPILGICRGMQEMNVASGGALEQKIENHDQGYTADERAAEVHKIHVEKNGVLAKILGDAANAPLSVNSIHCQGVVREGLAKCFRVEAMACDGRTVEAISMRDAEFVVGVQWHVEMKSQTSDMNAKIFQEFKYYVEEYSSMR